MQKRRRTVRIRQNRRDKRIIGNEIDAEANLPDGLETDKANKPLIAFYQLNRDDQ